MVNNNNTQDINLFLKYEPEKQRPKFDLLGVFLLAVIIAAGIVYLEFDMNSQLSSLQADIDFQNEYLMSTDVQEAMNRVQIKESLIVKLESLNNSFNSMESILRINGLLHVGLFSDINLSVPEFVYITDISMQGSNITINGYADSYKSVGEFEHNIRNNARFSEVRVPSISNNNGNYSFSMDIVLNMEV